MRNLASMRCPTCAAEYYLDLLAGNGLLTPMTLQASTGEVFGRDEAPWFADWLADGFRSREDTCPQITVESFRPIRRPLLVNTLDRLYGHGLLKLLSVQRELDESPSHDIILMIPGELRWLVPDGVAEVWSVDWPLASGTRWSDGLDRWIHQRLSDFKEVRLSLSTPHPAPQDVSIDRFTGVRPFDPTGWQNATERPVVTFIWRDDRVWPEPLPAGRWRQKLKAILGLDQAGMPTATKAQRLAVKTLAQRLHKRYPHLDFALVGLGDPAPRSGPIQDLRTRTIDEATEKAWCQRYARSHVVVGVHGSNMLLPSAHAGAVIDLMPRTRWPNLGQDLLLHDTDPRRELYRCRAVPASVSVDEIVRMIDDLLVNTASHLSQTRREMPAFETRPITQSAGQRMAA
ncbi:hypothetical protein [Mucisphaera sp.]|uniref:hypothetical protein n=1 Tax=Mucisphaera sp. TaxID=2913024 RepID=UPI003D1196A9